jgi:hypothetical protein
LKLSGDWPGASVYQFESPQDRNGCESSGEEQFEPASVRPATDMPDGDSPTKEVEASAGAAGTTAKAIRTAAPAAAERHRDVRVAMGAPFPSGWFWQPSYLVDETSGFASPARAGFALISVCLSYTGIRAFDAIEVRARL